MINSVDPLAGAGGFALRREQKIIGCPGGAGNVELFWPQWPERYELIAVTFRLTTDATAASRIPLLIVRTGSLVVLRCYPYELNNGQVASRDGYHTWVRGIYGSTVSAAAVTCTFTANLPSDFVIEPDYKVSLLIHDGQAGDTLSECVIVARPLSEQVR